MALLQPSSSASRRPRCPGLFNTSQERCLFAGVQTKSLFVQTHGAEKGPKPAQLSTGTGQGMAKPPPRPGSSSVEPLACPKLGKRTPLLFPTCC